MAGRHGDGGRDLCFRRETFITVPSAQLPPQMMVEVEEEEEEADLKTPVRLEAAKGDKS